MQIIICSVESSEIDLSDFQDDADDNRDAAQEAVEVPVDDVPAPGNGGDCLNQYVQASF